MSKLKTLKHIPEANVHVVPPLENEPPHRKLARLTKEQTEVTQALQSLRKAWAERNIQAQAIRQAVSTPEITHYETQKRDLALRLQNIQLEIGGLNRAIRASKGCSARNGRPELPMTNGMVRTVRGTQKQPLKKHPEFAVYFMLAARDELADGLYSQVERSAKSLLQHALDTGIKQ